MLVVIAILLLLAWFAIEGLCIHAKEIIKLLEQIKLILEQKPQGKE